MVMAHIFIRFLFSLFLSGGFCRVIEKVLDNETEVAAGIVGFYSSVSLP